MLLFKLLNFCCCAGFFKLLLKRFGIVRRKTCLDSLGGSVNKILGFFESESGSFTDSLNNGYLRGTGSCKNYVKFGLLFLNRSRSITPS